MQYSVTNCSHHAVRYLHMTYNPNPNSSYYTFFILYILYI